MRLEAIRESLEAMPKTSECQCDPSVGATDCLGCSYNYLVRIAEYVSSKDVLTIEKAVEIVGREWCESGSGPASAWYKWEDELWLTIRFPKHEGDGLPSFQIGSSGYRIDNATVGLFACRFLAHLHELERIKSL